VADEPMVDCRKCGYPVTATGYRFGSPENGWEHLPGECGPRWAPDTDDPAALIAAGLVAFDFTRQYVGEDVLPAIEGWSWFDWCQRAQEWLARHPSPDVSDEVTPWTT